MKRTVILYCTLEGTVSRDFLLQVFFHESSYPKPLKIILGSFRIFSKIHGDIRKSKYTTGINDTVGKSAIDINDTGGKFSTGVNGNGVNLSINSTVLLKGVQTKNTKSQKSRCTVPLKHFKLAPYYYEHIQ